MGYWEEDTCGHCGGKGRIVATCQYREVGSFVVGGCFKPRSLFGITTKPLCKNCAKKCKKCDKYFCPEHLKNHKCFNKIIKEG